MSISRLAVASLLATQLLSAAQSPPREAAAHPGTLGRDHALTRPRIVWRPIPFPAHRLDEMQAYAKRHYGIDSSRLTRPKVIIEHYTGSDSFASAYATFSADAPDSELHELPGTCAHFVIDKDGTIYQLVRLTTMCRHTVGLNWTAVGIEHVGTSDAEILGNRRQMASSLALTAWLMQRFKIARGNVIGHNESLTSKYRHELYAPWRCQTHGDWSRADMDVYRSQLSKFARANGVPLGAPVRPVTPRC
jgi:beta-N-acetylhexosaminidase